MNHLRPQATPGYLVADLSAKTIQTTALDFIDEALARVTITRHRDGVVQFVYLGDRALTVCHGARPG